MGLRAPQRTVLAVFPAPHPDMRDRYMWGAAPHPDQGKRYICEAPPRTPTVRGLYMRGFTPRPDLGSFFGKKLPKDPKKPN